MKTYNLNNNITIQTSYRKIEVCKNGRACFVLSKNINQDMYSLFDVRRGTLQFFINGWNKQKLIKQYVALCN